MLRTLTLSLLLAPMALAATHTFKTVDTETGELSLDGLIFNIDQGDYLYEEGCTSRMSLDFSTSGIKEAVAAGTIGVGDTVFTLTAKGEDDLTLFTLSATYLGDTNPGYGQHLDTETKEYVDNYAPLKFTLTMRGVSGAISPGATLANLAWINGYDSSFFTYASNKNYWVYQERSTDADMLSDYDCYNSLGPISTWNATDYSEEKYTVTSMTLSGSVLPTALRVIGDVRQTVSLHDDNVSVTGTPQITAVSTAYDSDGNSIYSANLTIVEETGLTGVKDEIIQSKVEDTPKNFNDITVKHKLTLGAGNLVADGKLTLTGDAVVTMDADTKLVGKTVDMQSGALIRMTNSQIGATGTTAGTIDSVTIQGTGLIHNLSVTDTSLSAGNSPGILKISETEVNGGTMSFYFGTELAESLTAGADTIALAGAKTSGFQLEAGAKLSGNITLDVWNTEAADDASTRTWDPATYTGSFTMGDKIQLISYGTGVNSDAVKDATFTLSSNMAALPTTEEGQSLAVVKTDDGVYLVTTPEPATTTLTLLALAGLAARRRRK